MGPRQREENCLTSLDKAISKYLPGGWHQRAPGRKPHCLVGILSYQRPQAGRGPGTASHPPKLGEGELEGGPAPSPLHGPLLIWKLENTQHMNPQCLAQASSQWWVGEEGTQLSPL